MIKKLHNQMKLAFRMLKQVYEKTPDDVFEEKIGEYYYWQEILHVLAGNYYWFRLGTEQHAFPFDEEKLLPELEGLAKETITKEELRIIFDQVEVKIDHFFGHENAHLHELSVVTEGLHNLEVVLMQVRHTMYHVGRLARILEGHDIQIEWEDYYGA